MRVYLYKKKKPAVQAYPISIDALMRQEQG